MSTANTQNLILNNEGVDNISDIVSTWMSECKIKKAEIIRVKYALEELLISIKDHYDEEVSATVQTGKRFGKNYCRITYDGKSYDPYSDQDDYDEWRKQLLAYSDISPIWDFTSGKNQLYFTLPRNPIKTETALLASVILAILVGLLKGAIPAETVSAVKADLLNPISNIFLNLMNTFAVFLIFFSVINGICGLGSASDFGRFGKTIILRFVNMTMVEIAAGMGLLYLFYRIPYGITKGSSQTDKVISNVLDIFPKDPITPFINGNTMQIVFMAILIGMIILANKNKLKRTNTMVIEMNYISISVVETICRFLPIYIFVTLTILFWEDGIGIAVKIWKPLLFYALMSFSCAFLSILHVSIKLKAKLSVLINKIKPTFLIGLTTASSMAAFSRVIDINEKKLGISPEVTKFGVPIGNLLCSTTTGLSIVTITYYLTDYYNMSVNVGWFLSLWFMAFVFAESLPPVSGGLLICLGIIISSLGIPKTGLAIAGTMALIFDFIDTSCRIVMSHMQLSLSANKLHKLDLDILRKK